MTTSNTANRRAWLAYPFTVLECILMAVVVFSVTVLAHLYYAYLWIAPELRKTKKYTNWANAMSSTEALETMRTVQNIAEQSNIKHYWIGGTLLGLVRQDRPLDHDHDLDLAVHFDEPRMEAFLGALRSHSNFIELSTQSLTWKCQVQNPDLSMIKNGLLRWKLKMQSSSGTTPIITDIFLIFPYKNGSIHATRNSLWWNSDNTSESRNFGQNAFDVPTHTDLHLRETYGNYKVEVKDFENSVDCPNAMNIFSWVSVSYLLRRKLLLIKLGNFKKVKLVNRRLRATILKGLLHWWR